MPAPTRVLASLKRRGIRGSAAAAGAAVRNRIHLEEAHVWYDLRLADAPAPEPWDRDLALVPGTEEDLHAVDVLELGAEAVRSRLRDGHQWWLVKDAGAIAFGCWIFRDRTAVLAAPGGWMELPPGRVCLEDSHTAATHRGRGIAPRAWGAIGAALRAEGVDGMITKVGVDNVPSRRAVVKAGFREVALMRFRRTGPRRRVEIEVIDEEPGRAIAERLAPRRRV